MDVYKRIESAINAFFRENREIWDLRERRIGA